MSQVSNIVKLSKIVKNCQFCQQLPKLSKLGPGRPGLGGLSGHFSLVHFWHLHHLGPFKTKINFSPQKHKVLLGQSSLEQKIKFCLKWSKRVQMSPKMSQMVKNMLYWPFGTIWDPFGPHRDIGKPAMLGHFWSQMGHFWCLPAMDLWLNGPKMAWILDLTWVKYIQVEWAPFLSITVSLAEKSVRKWPKMAKTMAIFCHKWLIKWQKKLFSSISSWQWLLVSFWSQSNIWKYLYRRPAS